MSLSRPESIADYGVNTIARSGAFKPSRTYDLRVSWLACAQLVISAPRLGVGQCHRGLRVQTWVEALWLRIPLAAVASVFLVSLAAAPNASRVSGDQAKGQRLPTTPAPGAKADPAAANESPQLTTVGTRTYQSIA